MSDILLTHGYLLADDETEQRVMKPYAPLGILSLSAYLKSAGFDVAVFDTTFRTPAEYTAVLAGEAPRMVGISVNMMTKRRSLAMLAEARAAGAFTVVGGPEPPHYAEEFLAAGADAVVIGEGEETLHALASAVLHGHGELGDIPGLVFRDASGRTIRTPPRTLLRSIDALPFPDRDAIDITPYFTAWRGRHGHTSMSIITMRGCPYTCTWCSHAVYGESYRRRSPELVADEIADMLLRYAPDHLWFADDVFTISHRWVHGLAEALDARGLHIRFECITRADRLNEEVIRTLARMGCVRVWIGAESGSQRVLDAMQRGVHVEQVEAMTHACRSAGIEVGTFIMLGYDGETVDDIRATARYLARAHPDIVLTTVAYPIKGTRFHDVLGDRAVVPPMPFGEWNDRRHVVRGRYSSRFYRAASRHLVHTARWHRLRYAGAGRRAELLRSWAIAVTSGMTLGLLSLRIPSSLR